MAILGLFLLPFPALAVTALLYGFYLRQQRARSQIEIDELTRQAAAQADEIASGKRRIEETLASHDRLTREFHHRVKNSLQIIQSYLALSRRQKPAPHNIYLAEAEAKVQVISTAYRLALSDGLMSPVPIRRFVADIVENTQAILCGPFARISATIELDGTLVLDRAIPLGLAIVEAVTGALGVAAVTLIAVKIRNERPSEAALIVTIDAPSTCITLPVRLLAGLQSQLGACVEASAEDEILHWRFVM